MNKRPQLICGLFRSEHNRKETVYSHDCGFTCGDRWNTQSLSTLFHRKIWIGCDANFVTVGGYCHTNRTWSMGALGSDRTLHHSSV